MHVATHTAAARSIQLDSEDRNDLVADVFVKFLENDFAILRRFRRQCSLATYLAVVARRVILRRLVNDKHYLELPILDAQQQADPLTSHSDAHHETRIDDRDHVEQLLQRLDGPDAAVVRMFHLEGRSYREISTMTGMAENSIGPVLSRAREYLRRNGD